MPQRPTPEYWRQRVKTVLSEHDGDISVRQIYRRIQAMAHELSRSNDPNRAAAARTYPSERTISRIREKEWSVLSESERSEYRACYWPESMERGDLPWEASAATLELILALEGEASEGRPSIRLARRFWQVALAAPDARLDDRLRAARLLAAWESLQTRPSDQLRGIEWYLAFAPWRSDHHSDSYEKAKLGLIAGEANPPVPPFPKRQISETQEGEGIPWTALEDLFGMRPIKDVRDISNQPGSEGEIDG